jgi:hypothetical protein
MNELNKELKNQAIALGLCQPWQESWKKDWSMEKMIEQMYKGLDFCLKHHWPSNDFIIRHFNVDFLRQSNVFVNDKYSVCNPKQSLVLGSSEITFRYNAWYNGSIHIRDNSSVKIYARNKSFVIIHLYEKAYIEAEQTDKATIVIIKHSPDVTIIADKNIKVKEEYDYLK